MRHWRCVGLGLVFVMFILLLGGCQPTATRPSAVPTTTPDPSSSPAAPPQSPASEPTPATVRSSSEQTAPRRLTDKLLVDLYTHYLTPTQGVTLSEAANVGVSHVMETWGNDYLLNIMSSSAPFNEADLLKRIKVTPATAETKLNIHNDWVIIDGAQVHYVQVRVKQPVDCGDTKVTITAQPVAGGPTFPADLRYEFHQVARPTIRVSSAEYPELSFPGGFAVHSGSSRLALSFSHPVDRDEVKDLASPATVRWISDREAELSLELRPAETWLLKAPSKDLRGQYFGEQLGLTLRADYPTSVLRVTAPGTTKEIGQLNNRIRGATLSPDGRRMVYAENQVLTNDPLWGESAYQPTKLWLWEMATDRRVLLRPNALMADVDPGVVWQGDSQRFWLLRSEGPTGSGVTAYSSSGEPLATLSAEWEGRSRRGMTAAGDGRLAIITFDDQAIDPKDPQRVAPTSLHIFSAEGEEVGRYEQVGILGGYVKQATQPFFTFTADGSSVIIPSLQRTGEEITGQYRAIDLDNGEVKLLPSMSDASMRAYGPDRYVAHLGNDRYEVRELDGQVLASGLTWFRSSAWSPDGNALAYLDVENHLHVCDLTTGTTTRWLEHELQALAGWGPDGIVVVAK